MAEMMEISGGQTALEMVQFGQTRPDGTRKILFELPVLGRPGVPTGLMSAFSIFYDLIKGGGGMTDTKIAQAWSYFINTLADLYPEATRQLARLDEEQLKAVIAHWVASSEGFDPKA